MQAGPKRTTFQREHDLIVVTELYLTGKRQVDIAALLNVTQQQVSYDLQEIQKRWRRASAVDIGEAKHRELERIDALERTYWKAWEESCKERKRSRQEISSHRRRNERLKATTETENLFGNPAYLAGIEYCISERCKILGLYAPTKLAPTSPDGTSPYTATSDDFAQALSELKAWKELRSNGSSAPKISTIG